ncbi:heparinase II/III-like protein [Dyadobacter jejuensis]|uniref:Heparinase II/III-like protein n=1 Tax=Dyadobacter jejuensis TaxID=1082580 RepID=A0A316AQQ8_9BACT|nr:heparinase II/III-family protein [Dyadobacter jejuensis]PWJ59932.1 heparinase II/III-like protein [Dyadobacter jejuensis]
MVKILTIGVEMIRNMGLTYLLYRVGFILLRKTGWFLKTFPMAATDNSSPISLEDWLKRPIPFIMNRQSGGGMLEGRRPQPSESVMLRLKHRAEAIARHRYLYFGATWLEVPDWHTHPITHYRYPPGRHWSSISDFTRQHGDIKYIWEKGRFGFLIDLIRYEWYSGVDQWELVARRITSWINDNPVNCGPHWYCGQEIALRVLHWTYALHFYRNRISAELFAKMMNSIRQQMLHVAESQAYDRVTVRNNHVLTQFLALYTVGSLFPFLDESNDWKQLGKEGFESEILFQISEEGSYLQHSMNYHRVVVQLLTWAFRLSQAMHDPFKAPVIDRAKATLSFLRDCQDPHSGWLPHYGPHDGSLFFSFSDEPLRDFRPQLASLAHALAPIYASGGWQEELGWWGMEARGESMARQPCLARVTNYDQGGYYILKDRESMSFLRNTAYITRPFQADNLHLDLWVQGKNILRDAGTFSYHQFDEGSAYFSGTAAHNTVQINASDQMQRGPRFVWNHWVGEASGGWSYHEERKQYIFYGYFIGYKHLAPKIVHRRIVTKPIGELCWVVEDWLEGVPAALPIRQLWHPSPGFERDYSLRAVDAMGQALRPSAEVGWHADTYGHRQRADQLYFALTDGYIKTTIQRK